MVTGADGFIGSHLVERLIADGHKVRAFTYYNSFNSWGWLDTIDSETLKSAEIVQGDIRDSFFVENASEGMEMIFHLAALISIPYSYHSPESYIDTNIKGTLNILQSARKHKTGRVLITSTSEVYGTAKYVPIDEIHPRQGQSPYSASKIGADYLSDSFYRSFNIPLTIVRPFNTYGPRQSARAVIPTIITQLLSGSREIKLGSLHPTRDLVYVKDTVEGFVKISGCEKLIGEEVNIATNSEISVGNVADRLIRMINPEARIISDDIRKRPENSEVERLFGSDEKIKKFTGWKNKYTLEEGLKETISWLKIPENLKRYKSEIYNY